MSFAPDKDPKRRRRAGLRRHRTDDRSAQRRSRRLLGAPRAAPQQAAHGRPLHLLRSFRAGRVPQRPGHRRAAASAYRARHRHLPVRRRDHAPRQPRHRGADPPGRGQLDDRGTRHRAFRAHRAGAPHGRRAAARTAVLGRPAGQRRGDRRRASRMSAAPSFRS